MGAVSPRTEYYIVVANLPASVATTTQIKIILELLFYFNNF